MKPKALLLTVMLGTAATMQAEDGNTLVINELMQSNVDCIMDDLNDFPDSWVELYNPTDAAISLKDYKIGTKDKAGKAWQLPDKTVAAKGYIVIYCDKAGGDEGVSAMHTDFRLESGKDGALYLFKGSEIVDKLEGMAKQPAPNIAYGRKTDGAEEWGYQATPTPEEANCGQTYKKVLGAPVFSQKGRVMENGQMMQLTLSVPEGAPEGTEIRYTLDGKEPTKSSQKYTAALSFSSTKTIRAKLFCDGYLSPRSTCHSYIFFPANRALTLPVVSIMTDNEYLNDAKIGIYVDGTYSSKQKNYEYDWRRPMNIEFFETSGQESVINQLGEMRICGGATRTAVLKSLAVYANKRFDAEHKRFSYEFFPDQKPGLKEFKSIMLRNAGNDFDGLYMRDAIIQRTMAQHVDLDWQAWRPAIVYINGAYKGIQNIRERSNEDNIYTNYDGLEDIDMIENGGELKQGSMDNYEAFVAFYTEHGHTLAEYAEWMDWQEYINLMVENMYFNNLDFPGNNNVIWRPTAEGGKWRWITKDTDFGLGLYDVAADYNIVMWMNDNNYDSIKWANTWEATRLFRRLMEDADFKREFMDRAAIYMGDFLNEQGTRAVWDPMYELIKTEYTHHREPINRWWPNYSEELDKARSWLSQRTNHFYKQLADYYQWGTATELTINKTSQEDIAITFNGIRLSNTVFDGKYWSGRNINLSAASNTEGKTISGWKVTGALSKEVQGSELTLLMPSDSIAINPIMGNATGIENVQPEVVSSQQPVVYDLLGNKVATPQRGRIYLRNGKKVLWQ